MDFADFEHEEPAEYAVMLGIALVTLVFASLLIVGVVKVRGSVISR